MENNSIKNSKQVFFNQLRGLVLEIIVEEQFTTIALQLGHENTRSVAFVSKNEAFEQYKDSVHVGDKILVRFYISSRKKHDRWYTTATVLDIQKEL
jgi:hypothetical protein